MSAYGNRHQHGSNQGGAMSAYLEQAIGVLLSPVAPVYDTLAGQSARAPYITYTFIVGTTWRYINGPSGIRQVTVQVDAYSQTVSGRAQMARDIRLILDGYRGIVSAGNDSPQATLRIAGVSYQNERTFIEDGVDPKLYRSSVDYLFTIED